MKITDLGTESDGIRSFGIDTISYPALLRCIRRIPGAVITKAWHHPITEDAEIIVTYKDITMTIVAAWADYMVRCTSSSEAFDEFVSKLSSSQAKWWDHIQIDPTSFSGSRFTFWTVSLFLLSLNALIFWGALHGNPGKLVSLIPFMLTSLLVMLGFYNPVRFWWSLCCFTAIIFLLCLWYLIDELAHGDKSEIFEAMLGLLFIGLPCLLYTITGFYTRRRAREAGPQGMSPEGGKSFSGTRDAR